MASDLAGAAFKQKNWKEAVALGTIAAESDDDTVRAEGWLTVGESELKQRRFAQAAKAFESVGTVSDVEAGVRFRALAGLGLAREELKEWKGALAAYEAVAKNSPDPTLRDWARARVAAVKPYATKPGNGTAPKRSEPAKPGSKKS
jgi:tetratricopeptide (TPR) repeat protein